MSWTFVAHNLVYGPVLKRYTKTIQFETGVEGVPTWWFAYLFLEQLAFKDNSKYQLDLKKIKIRNKISPEPGEPAKLQAGRVDAEPAVFHHFTAQPPVKKHSCPCSQESGSGYLYPF